MVGVQLGAALRHVQRLFSVGTVAGLSDAELLERFAVGRDEAAFEALVSRHGRMVLAVCRGVLKDPHDAEDAFQATFLVLVRKAGSLRLAGSLGSWLYRVAYRVAVQANMGAARRRERERQGVIMDVASVEGEGTRPELSPLLHEEVARLPEKYRAAVVLCYLEGLTREQAAEQLRLPAGTVGSRMARGRDLLRSRLRRRGITLAGGLLVAALDREARAAVPDAWVGATVRAAASAAAGRAAAVTLTEEVLRTMWMAKLSQFAAFALIGGGALALAGAALVGNTRPADNPPPVAPQVVRAPATARDAEASGTFDVRGRVLDPDGKPVARAEIYVRHRNDADRDATNTAPHGRSVRAAESDADGRFAFKLDKAASDWPHGDGPAWHGTLVTAVATGYGPAWIDAGSIAKAGEATLKLVRDDLPIRGRVLDAQGRPAAGVAVRVAQIGAPQAGMDLDALLATGVCGHDVPAAWCWDPTWLGSEASWTTDADGRFEIRGIGRDRIAVLEFLSPSLEKSSVHSMTRPSTGTPKPRPRPSRPRDGMRMIGMPPAPRLVGATFDQIAGPTRPIVGVVRLKGTGKPVAGVRLFGVEPASWTEVQATTDLEGRFRLVGLPKAESYLIRVSPQPGVPYLGAEVTVTDTEGLGPIETALKLPRGVVVRFRLVDKATGKAATPTQVMHIKLPANTNEGGSSDHLRTSRDDGSFLMTVPPGEGFFAAAAKGGDALYTRARLAPADRGRGVGGIGDNETITTVLSAMHAYKIVDVRDAADNPPIVLEMTRGPGLKGTVVDPDGKSISGVQAYGLVATWGKIATLDGDAFEVIAMEPGHPRRLMFTLKGRKLAGSVVLGDAELKSAAPLVVRLAPIGVIRGRLLDEDGTPLAGAELSVAYYDLDGNNLPLGPGGVWPTDEKAVADAEGRFEFAAIIPGLEAGFGVEVKGRPGEYFRSDKLPKRFTPDSNRTVELGDVPVKSEPRP